MEHSDTPARIGVGAVLRILNGLARVAVRTSFRRLTKGRAHPEWSFAHEVASGCMRYMVSLTPKASVPQIRRFLGGVNRWNFTPKGLFIEVERVGGVLCEHIFGSEKDAPLLVYLHGGGYNLCSTATHRSMVAWMCKQGPLECYSVEYRLAPEDPFPAAVEDAVAVYRALLDDGHDPANIIFAGDSAGGGLAIAAALTLRDAGDRLPAAVVGISPWVNLKCDGSSFERNAAYDYLSEVEGLTMAENYAHGEALDHPLISPLFADLSNLPPLFLQVGELEVLHDDIIALAEKARSAGNLTTVEVYPGMVHVWHMFFRALPAARDALRSIAAHARETVGHEAMEKEA